MRPAVRLAALMKLPVTYVWTHDSIGLGEDGPTHQPVEHLAALRAIPGLDVVRPGRRQRDRGRLADRSWSTPTGPAGLALTRQNLPTLRPRRSSARAEGVAKGGYVLADASDGQPQVILVGTGSEVQLAVAARERLEAEGTPTRVVSMPCGSGSTSRTRPTGSRCCRAAVKARVSVEAGSRMGWRELVGDAGEIVSLEHFGASAAAHRALRAVRLHRRPGRGRRARDARHGRRHHRQHDRQLTAPTTEGATP